MGMRISVLRDADLGDCTNGGISSRADVVIAVNVPGPFEPSDKQPAVILDSHFAGIVRLVPAVKDIRGNWVADLHRVGAAGPMMGGNFGATSDGRFTEAIEKLTKQKWYGAVAIHDRYETAERIVPVMKEWRPSRECKPLTPKRAQGMQVFYSLLLAGVIFAERDRDGEYMGWLSNGGVESLPGYGSTLFEYLADSDPTDWKFWEYRP